MFHLTFIFILIFFNIINTSSCSDINNTELVLSFMLFRHGDKTPIKAYIELVKYKDTLSNLTQPYGFGQLTLAGKKKGYAIGQFIKNRYSDLLQPAFDPGDIFVRSTFISRTILTALNAIAAIYSLPQSDWVQTMDWTPLPYSTVVPKYDFNAGYVNCPVYSNASRVVVSSRHSVMKPFMWMRDMLLSETGFDMAEIPILTLGIYDLLTSQESVGYKLKEKLKGLLPALKEAADAAASILFGKEEFVPLLSGVLLNEFFKAVESVKTCEESPKIYMYAGHDANVYSFMRAAMVSPSQGYPLPASLFALELRRDLFSGRYLVLPYFVSQPGKSITYLTVTECGSGLCELSKFQAITSKYALDIDTWRSRCGWNDDMYISDCVIT